MNNTQLRFDSFPTIICTIPHRPTSAAHGPNILSLVSSVAARVHIFSLLVVIPNNKTQVQRQRRLPESPDPPYANRYPLQIPESLTGSSSWMEGDHLARQEEAEAEEEGDGEGSVPREPATEDIDMAVSLPRNLNDLGLQIPSRPSDIDVTSRAHSLSPKGVQQIHDIRVSFPLHT